MDTSPTRASLCRACSTAGNNRHFRVREMMFGSREEFEYFECTACGAVQISQVPPDLERHYPADYYSFQNRVPSGHSRLKTMLKHARAKHGLGHWHPLGAALACIQGAWPYFQWFKAAGISFNSSILDVGCGAGDYLRRFASDGFTSLTGVDPFIPADIADGHGITIYKRTLAEVPGQFDCVFSHHSFEHMEDPRQALAEMTRVARPGGVILLAVPVAGCWAWEQYGTDWYQIDAPRHVLVPSPESIRRLAAHAGLSLDHIFFDSTDEQILVSELYRRGVAFVEYARHGAKAYFTGAQIAAARKRAAALNATGRGDRACFILRKRRHP